MKKKYIWYCESTAGVNHESLPRFATIKEVMADIKKQNGCSDGMCEDQLIIFDLEKNKAVKKFFYNSEKILIN